MVLTALIVVSSAASASVVLKLDVSDMTRMSHAVVVGQVIDTRSEWNPGHEYIQTLTRIRVETAAKCACETGRVITVRELGGSVGDYNQEMIGAATYAPGEKVLVFLERAANGTSGIFQTLALSAGKFLVSTDSQTGRTIAVPAAHDLMYADEKPTIFDDGPVDLDIVLDEIHRHANDR